MKNKRLSKTEITNAIKTYLASPSTRKKWLREKLGVEGQDMRTVIFALSPVTAKGPANLQTIARAARFSLAKTKRLLEQNVQLEEVVKSGDLFFLNPEKWDRVRVDEYKGQNVTLVGKHDGWDEWKQSQLKVKELA